MIYSNYDIDGFPYISIVSNLRRIFASQAAKQSKQLLYFYQLNEATVERNFKRPFCPEIISFDFLTYHYPKKLKKKSACTSTKKEVACFLRDDHLNLQKKKQLFTSSLVAPSGHDRGL